MYGSVSIKAMPEKLLQPRMVGRLMALPMNCV